MLQLAYISTSRTLIDDDLLRNILAVSRKRNEASGVTGLLVTGGKRFLQVIEGPDHAVLATYSRIQADERHRGFVLISSANTETRAFGNWSMAYRYDEDAGNEGLEAAVAALTANVADPNLRAQFAGFAKLHGRAA